MKIPHLALHGLLVLFWGCVSSGGPPPPRFSIPPGIDCASEWVGRYAGKGSVYSRRIGDWQHEQPLAIEITSNQPNRLAIIATPERSEAFSFVIHGQLSTGSVLASQWHAPDGTHYVYSFARTETQLTGVVKWHWSGDSHEVPDEWVFALDRQPDLP